MNIILASTSSYRKSLIEKLGIPFSCIAPLINEDSLKMSLTSQSLSPSETAEKLSYEKGLSVFKEYKDKALVISGDQLVCFENKILGKPKTIENAIEQLSLLNNKTHQLITSITLFNREQIIKYNHITHLKMKKLTQFEVKNYINKDKPLDCAGSYKIEESGIILFESIDTDDFSAIQGVPLIWLSNQLKEFGYEFFKN